MQNQGRLVEKEPWRVNRQAQEGKQPARSKRKEHWRVNRQAQEKKSGKKWGKCLVVSEFFRTFVVLNKTSEGGR